MRIVNIQREIFKHDENVNEAISHLEAKQAFLLLKSMTLNNTDDHFLFFSAINLLNTYTKREDALEEFRGQYSHKYYVNKGIDSAIENNIEDVTFSHNKDGKGSVLIVNVDDTQFAFHEVTPSGKMDFAANNRIKQHQKQEWEGVKLQPCAKTIFNSATKLYGLSKETIAGCTTDELLEQVREEFLQEDFKKGKGHEVINDFNRAIALEATEKATYYIGSLIPKQSRTLLESLGNARYKAQLFMDTINSSFRNENVDMNELMDKLEQRRDIDFADLPSQFSKNTFKPEKDTLNSYSILVYLFDKEWEHKDEFVAKFFDSLEERIVANTKMQNKHLSGFAIAMGDSKDKFMEEDDVIKNRASTQVNDFKEKLTNDAEKGFYNFYLDRNSELVEEEGIEY